MFRPFVADFAAGALVSVFPLIFSTFWGRFEILWRPATNRLAQLMALAFLAPAAAIGGVRFLEKSN